MSRRTIPIPEPISQDTIADEPRPARKPRVVFLDVGETLVAPHPSFAGIFRAACEAEGVLLPEAAETSLAGRVAAELASWRTDGRCFSISEASSRGFWQDIYRRQLQECGCSFPASLRFLSGGG